MLRILKLLFCIAIASAIMVSLSSCDPMRRAIRKHDRLIERFPTLHKREFVTLRDTLRITIPEIKHDTVVHEKTLFDTVVIEKDRLKVKVYQIHDSIYIEGKCDSIYVEKIVEKKVPVIYYPEKSNEWNWLWWILIGLFILGVLYIVLNRKKKREDEHGS